MNLPDPKAWHAIARKLRGYSGFEGAPNDYNGDEQLVGEDEVDKYSLITNQLNVADGEKQFLVVLDIDFPVVAVDSGTPGHSHLVIDKALTQEESNKLLSVLVEVGLVEAGYAEASGRRGLTRVRTPWNLKPDTSMFWSIDDLRARREFREAVKALEAADNDEGILKTDLEPESEFLASMQDAALEPVVVEEKPLPSYTSKVNPFHPEPGITPGYPQERT